MTLLNIGVFILAALVFRFLPLRWKPWALLIGSVAAIYWLQPKIAVRPLDFAFPTATLALALIGWLVTKDEPGIDSQSRWTLGLVTASVIVIALIGGITELTPSQPPDLLTLGLPLIGIGAVIAASSIYVPERGRAIPAFMLLIIGLFVILKADALRDAAATWLRGQNGYLLGLASGSDLEWLGFSYVAFRLIHTLRDRQTGKLPALTLREYMTYLIFFPAFTAGPI